MIQLALGPQPSPISRGSSDLEAIYHPRAHEIFAIDITHSAYLQPPNRSPVTSHRIEGDARLNHSKGQGVRQGLDAVESWSMGFPDQFTPLPPPSINLNRSSAASGWDDHCLNR